MEVITKKVMNAQSCYLLHAFAADVLAQICSNNQSTGLAGTLTSPSVLSDYGHGISCSHNISVPVDAGTVTLNFTAFSIVDVYGYVAVSFYILSMYWTFPVT